MKITSSLPVSFAAASRKAQRNQRRSWLRSILLSKDKLKIWQYCYQRAMLKDSIGIMTDLVVYGQSSYIVDKDKVEIIMKRICWWAARLNRMCGV